MTAKQFEIAKSLQFLGSIVLRLPAKPIEKISKDTKLLAEEMLYLMKAFNAVGLAANQVGILQRIIVVNLNSPLIMINPIITFDSEITETEEEGCLSLPGFYKQVERYQTIKAKYQGTDGKEYRLKAEGLAARIIQHEVDHLDGTLIIDREPR